MNRRTYLSGIAAGVCGLAGCLSDGVVRDDDAVYEVAGQEVPLASLEEAVAWHAEGTARFVDARSESAYQQVRIEGAVYSPAPDGLTEEDPVAGWSTDERIVTYCVCPHTLAGQRAASLLHDGYGDVHALGDGLEPWVEEGHPIEGDEVGELASYEVRGESASAHAGEYVWIREPETDQREVGEVAPDGTYELTLHFTDVDGSTLLEIDAPDYTVERTLAEATDGVVRP